MFLHFVCYIIILLLNNIFYLIEEGENMKYEKPVVVAQSTALMAECRPNSKPSGRPCNPPGPGGR